MSLDSLHDLYVEELKDIHSAERQLLRALPRMAKAADSPELRAAFELHLKETEKQIERLDKIFAELEKKGTGKKCVGMEGLLQLGDVAVRAVDVELDDPTDLLEVLDVTVHGRLPRSVGRQHGPACAGAP